MKFSIFRRFSLLIFTLTTVLGILFIVITYWATTYYHEASMQLLNKDVAAHIATFTSPYTSRGIDQKKADSVFQNAMILSPGSEVYFLDSVGKVIYFHASEKEIREWVIPLAPLDKYVATEGRRYVKGDDPKDPGRRKIFSAAKVTSQNRLLGYIYVILDSRKSETVMDMLFGSHILSLAIKVIVLTVILSFVLSLFYLRRISKNFREMVSVINRFESGDYNARFSETQQNELQPFTSAFNKMADLLTDSIGSLRRSEEERKNFVAAISHDLRTPLAIARGYTETLLLHAGKAAGTDADQQSINLIYSKILQLENMVKQLFDLSKIEAVQFRPAKEPFVLSEIVQEAVDTFKLLATEKNIRLACAQCLFHVWIIGDVSMLERVIQNLVDNALKNTPAGGSVLAAMRVEGDELVFRLDNDGPALPADIPAWINNGEEKSITERRPQQAGLGLLIIQKILYLHGAALRVTRENDRNIFTFRFPVYHPPA